MTTQNHFLHHLKKLLMACKYVLFRSGEFPHLVSRDTQNALRRAIEMLDRDLTSHTFKKPRKSSVKEPRENLVDLHPDSQTPVGGDAAQG